MTNANDLLRTIVLQFIFIIVNGFVTLDEIQNGYHSEKQAYVGQYFKETIDFGPELFCNVSRVQVSGAYSHEQPSWLMLNDDSRFLYGIPQENEIGSEILFVTGFDKNVEGQEFICSQLVWKVTIELDPDSLVSTLNLYIENRTSDQKENDALQRCLYHPSIIIATLSIGVRLGTPTATPIATLANLIAESLNISNDVIQIVHSSSSITFYKQLKGLKIFQYKRFLNPNLGDTLYHVSWPLGCDHNNFDLSDIHKVHRRSLSGVTDLKISSWHLTSGRISGEVLARKRRAVFFGSITALEGTPLETSILPTKILTSAIFTSISSVNGTHSLSSTLAFPTSSLNPSTAFKQTSASSALSSLPTTKLTSFVLSTSYQTNANITSPLSRSEASSTSLYMTSRTISSDRTPSLEPYSSRTYLPTLMSFSSVLHESTYGPFMSSYPSSVLGSSFRATLSSFAYFSSSLPYPQSSLQGACSSGSCVSASTSFGALSNNSTLESLASATSSLTYSSGIIHQRTNSSYSLSGSFLQSETATIGAIITDTTTSSTLVSSSGTSLYTSIMLSSIVPAPYSSVISVSTPFLSTKIAESLYSTSSLYSLHYPETSFSTPYKRNSTELSSVISLVRSSTAFISSSIDANSFTFQTMTMRSASIVLPITTRYTEVSSSHFLGGLSSSVQYQRNSTEISDGTSMILSSIAGSVTSSRGAILDATSRTESVLVASSMSVMSKITSEPVSRYTEIPSFSIPPQRYSTGTSMLISMVSGSTPTASSLSDISHVASQLSTVQLPFSGSTLAASSVRRDTSYITTQTATVPLPSLLPSINNITASQYSQRSFASTATVTLGDMLTNVRSSLTFQLESISSSYSLIPLYSSSQSKDTSGNVSSFGRTVAPSSSMIPSSFITKSSTPSPSESDHSTFGQTITQLSYINQSSKSTPSNLILTTAAIITPSMTKSATGVFSSNRTSSNTVLVSSLERVSSSTILFSEPGVITASLHSPIVGFSSGFSVAPSGYSSQTISTVRSTLLQHTTIPGSTQNPGISTVVSVSSDLSTYQSLSLASHFANLTLLSASTEAFSISSTVVVTQMPNTSPKLVNSIGRVTAYVGRLLIYKVPFDTFYDKESGYTPNLVVRCRYATGQPLEKSFWIVYDNITQTFTGLPLIDVYNKQGSEGARLEVLAMDQFGSTARDVFSVYIENTAVDIQFALSARISRQFQEFQADSSLKVALFNRIIRFYNTSASSSYYVASLTNGSVLFAWSDTTISGTSCNQSAITQIASFVRAPSGSVTSKFAQALLPDFPVLGVTLNYYGVCSITPTTSAAPVGPVAGERTGDIFTRFVVPAIAAAVVLALIIGVFIFLSKRRRNKPSFLEKRTFRKGRPVLLPEEYELDGIKSPVVSLPEDYVFSNAGDRHSVHSRRLSDNGDEDDKVYMDNPLYGLSEFKKPPPAYNKETDIDEVESDYESPYERPPPSYQLPPFYVDQDFMTSEV